jgi:hypothetical protein
MWPRSPIHPFPFLDPFPVAKLCFSSDVWRRGEYQGLAGPISQHHSCNGKFWRRLLIFCASGDKPFEDSLCELNSDHNLLCVRNSSSFCRRTNCRESRCGGKPSLSSLYSKHVVKKEGFPQHKCEDLKSRSRKSSSTYSCLNYFRQSSKKGRPRRIREAERGPRVASSRGLNVGFAEVETLWNELEKSSLLNLSLHRCLQGKRPAPQLSRRLPTYPLHARTRG